MNAPAFDLELIRKYDVAAPRYTSYPPATQFVEMAGGEIIERLRGDAESARDVSLYFHLPFCHSLCWYCACTTVITPNQGASARYMQYLEREVAAMAPLIGRGRNVVQLHLGGGTPTFLLPEEIRHLGRIIRSHFTLDARVEAGVEIDPRYLTRAHVAALCEAGINRASVGVQDFDPAVQAAVHRVQPQAQTQAAVDWLREAGFESLNIDLIYGLPHQSVESFGKTLDAVLAMRPDRLAVFNYAHVPWIKPAQKILKALPSAETKLQLLKLTVERLTAGGYCYIGMDHFALADDELAVAQRNKTLQRNFQGYSTRANADIHAFGMSAISQARGAYWQNHKALPDYYKAIDEGRAPIAKGCLLTGDDKIRREVIARLMCDLALDFDKISERIGVDFSRYFSRELASLRDLEEDGLIEISPGRINVTDIGRLLIRNIAVRFDAYYQNAGGGRFSKSI